MTFPDIATLNERFAVDGAVRFGEGNAGMTKVDITFNEARLELYLQGAHITRYQPIAAAEVLWMSDTASYHPAKASTPRSAAGVTIIW
jgi:glucose-6-phosphate 1-epimerase